jgi:Mg-chelatase subunit ChlD
MTLLSPIWLLVIIPLALGLWLFRPASRWLFALRALSLALVVLALAGLSLRLPSRAGTVVVVADRSLSMPASSTVDQKENIRLIHSKMSNDDLLAVVSFGQQVAVEHPPSTIKFADFQHQVGGNASSLGEAIESALSLIPRDSPGRVLVLSDGKWTGRDPTTLAPLALGRNIAIDYRAQERPGAGDLAIGRIDAPAVVAPGESFLISAWVQAPSPQKVTFTLKQGDRVVATGERQLVSGANRLTFRDRAVQGGNQAYTLEVKGADKDPFPENNTAKIIVGVGGPRPLLHVSDSPSSGLAKLLTKGRLDIRSVRPGALTWTLEELSRYSGLVLENVPGDKIGQVGMETISAWVKETGAGLMMTGGRSSYGPGGYYKSPLEPIMPVSMELRNEHRKLSLAIVVALDRSGSMSAPVSGGKQKMDLANLGAAQVVDLLGPQDEFGCIAVDTEPHQIAPLSKNTDKDGVKDKLLRIRSQGGGIFIDVALMAASQMLLKATAGTKHIILFSDATDSEQPGNYKDLLEKCEKAGITVSVIGLGRETDQDGELLKDIARRGKGRIFFTDKPDELPRLFAQDTFVVARNTFLDEPVSVRNMPGLDTLTDQKFPTDPRQQVGGYNLCYIRPGATQGTVTLDEYNAPLVAAWRAGAGRVVCFTGEADGKYAGAFATWDRVGDYYTSLARWTAGPTGALRNNMLLTQEVREGINVVQLHLDPERKGDPFSGLPTVKVLRSLPGQAPRTETAKLRWTGADTLALEVTLDSGETTLATVDVPGHGAVPLPPVCVPYSPEFRPSQSDRGLVTLERLGRATGGKERIDLTNIWQDLPRQVRLMPVGRWLLLAAVLCLLVEVFERRTLLLSGLFRRRRRVKKTTVPSEPEMVAPAPSVPASGGVLPRPEKPARSPAVPRPQAPAATVAKEDNTGMLDALRKARQKARGRTEG